MSHQAFVSAREQVEKTFLVGIKACPEKALACPEKASSSYFLGDTEKHA